MEVEYKPEAIKDIQYFKKSGDRKLLRKIQNLIQDVQNTPTSGLGKPELLKEDLAGYWSRRINSEHRLVYKIDYERNCVVVYSLKGHY